MSRFGPPHAVAETEKPALTTSAVIECTEETL